MIMPANGYSFVYLHHYQTILSQTTSADPLGEKLRKLSSSTAESLGDFAAGKNCRSSERERKHSNWSTESGLPVPKGAQKHEKISSVLEFVETFFAEQYNQMSHADGGNVIRIDVKTMDGLDHIEDRLVVIKNLINVLAVSTRSSLKKN